MTADSTLKTVTARGKARIVTGALNADPLTLTADGFAKIVELASYHVVIASRAVST